MPTSEFQFLGVPHIVALALTIALPIALSVLVRKAEDSQCCTGADSSVLTNAVCYLLAGILIINEIGGWIYRAVTVQSFSYLCAEPLASPHLRSCTLCRGIYAVASEPDPL